MSKAKAGTRSRSGTGQVHAKSSWSCCLAWPSIIIHQNSGPFLHWERPYETNCKMFRQAPNTACRELSLCLRTLGTSAGVGCRPHHDRSAGLRFFRGLFQIRTMWTSVLSRSLGPRSLEFEGCTCFSPRALGSHDVHCSLNFKQVQGSVFLHIL